MYDVVIIGAGAAGLTAAIYTARSGLKTLIIEHKFIGGQTSVTASVENYPGVMNANGAVLTDVMKKQALSFGAELVMGSPEDVDFERKTVKLKGEEIRFGALILCMGAKNRKLGLEREDLLAGAGVSYCATCDGNFFKGKDVAVVGGGNTALEDAIYLSRICNTVYLIHRRDEFRGEKALVKRLAEKENVEIVYNSTLEDAEGSPLLKNITVKDKNTLEERTIAVSGLFLAIGQVPGTDGFGDILPLDEYGYVLVDESCKVKDGIYVCGDCRKKTLRQLTTAVSDGSVAGAAIE